MLMYNAVIPDHNESSRGGSADGSGSPKSLSLFDVGKRLLKGNGV